MNFPIRRSTFLFATSFVIACHASDGADQNDGSETTNAAEDATSAAMTTVDPGTTSSTGAADGDGSSSSSSGGESTDTGEPDEPSSDPLHGLPTGEDQWEILCARNHDDAIARAFCAGDAPPSVTSITELLELVGLGFVEGNLENGLNGNPGLTLTYHSTAIGTRFVNEINPRAFVFTPPVGGVSFPPSGIPNPDLVMMGYARGESFVELVANDRTDDELRFYLFRFVSPCEESDEGCTNADLFTPSVESGFVGYSLYDDYDVRDTVVDCLQCHQPDGPGTQKLLRMQEFEEGWTHWFYPNRVQNREAMQMFVDTHIDESYGGIPAAMLTQQALLQNNEGTAAPTVMEQTIRNQGFDQQPNEFPSQQIITERVNAGCFCNNCMPPPPIDPTTSCSPTWDALFANAVQGDAIPVPYFDGHITDPVELATTSQAYRDVMAGTLPADQLPDMRDVLREEGFPYMSYAPAPGLDGAGILKHMCGHCHNSTLDQTISRANFNAHDLDSVSDAVKGEAILRLQLPDDDIERMPPVRFHTLSDDELALVIGELSQ